MSIDIDTIVRRTGAFDHLEVPRVRSAISVLSEASPVALEAALSGITSQDAALRGAAIYAGLRLEELRAAGGTPVDYVPGYGPDPEPTDEDRARLAALDAYFAAQERKA